MAPQAGKRNTGTLGSKMSMAVLRRAFALSSLLFTGLDLGCLGTAADEPESARSSPPDITPYSRPARPEDVAPGGKPAIPSEVMTKPEAGPKAPSPSEPRPQGGTGEKPEKQAEPKKEKREGN